MQHWMVATIKDLQLLEQRRMAVCGYNIQIKALDHDIESLSGVSFGKTPTRSGGNRTEERLTRWLDRKARLERERDKLLAVAEHTEACLALLPERERAVLSVFYLEGLTKGMAVRKLEQELYVSEATVYRIRERALTKLAMMMGYL